MKWVIRILFGLIFSMTCQAQTPENAPLPSLKTGDFLFLDLDCGPLCDAIEAVTPGYKNQKFSHVGMVVFRHDSCLILEAIKTSVRLTLLTSFLAYSPKKPVVGRLKTRYQPLIPAATSFGLSCVGMPYDDAFLPENQKYYCSELLYDAFKSAQKGKPFFPQLPMTFQIPGTNHFFPEWVTYYQQLQMEIPEGKPGCNPGGLLQSGKFDIIYP